MLKGIIFSILAILILGADDIPEEDGVLVLTSDNFKQAVGSIDNILVEFYAPWCGHCKALAPNYAKAAELLQKEGSEIRLAKVDATIHSDLAQKFGVRGYPTIKFFRGEDNVVDYSAGRQAEDIVNWLKKKTGPPATDLTTAEQAKEFSESAEAVVVGFFESAESEEAKAYVAAVTKLEDMPAGIVTNKEVAESLGATVSSIVMFQKFDDGKVVYSGEYNGADILSFVNAERLPLFIEFNDKTANSIFSGSIKVHFLVFYSDDSDEAASISEAVTAVAKEFRGRIIFVRVNTDVENNNRIVEFFNLKEDDFPCGRLIQLDDDMRKFRPDFDSLNEENIRTFLTNFFDGKLKPHLSSEDIPEDWDAKPVKILVGRNFWDVIKSGKDVFVEFYAPWCGHCKALAPTWDELGEKFVDSDVIIAKIDSTANEIDGIKIEGFPTLKYFKSDDPESPIDFMGGRTLDDLVKFVESKGTDHGVKEPSEDLGDEFFDSLEDEDFEDEDYEDEDEDEGMDEQEDVGEPAKDKKIEL